MSRNTLRAALAQLKREGVIRSEHGAGNRILQPPTRRAGGWQSRAVGLLTPEALERLRPSQTLWIDELRALLSERNCRLHVFSGPQYFRPNPGRALQRLLAQHPHACWILVRSNAAIQEWFGRHSAGCVVAGSVHAGLDLVYRDLDHHAVCRHAGGVLLGLGHRRIALLVPKPPMAGDLESEAGLLEAVRCSSHADAEAILCEHEGGVAGIGQALRRLLERKAPPTALVVANAYHYLTVTGWLAQMGRRVPQDVSVISRDEDLFLSYLVPPPTRYAANPRSLARSLLHPVLEILDGGQPARRRHKLMPDFVRGGSVAACAGG